MRLAHPKGLLFIIGGGEDKEGDCTILAPTPESSPRVAPPEN